MKNGFTILEIIIVIAMISLVATVTAPLGIQFYNSQTLNSVESQIGDSLTRARSQSMVQKNDSQFGMCLNTAGGFTTSFVLYQGIAGSACSTHTTINDEQYPILGNTTVTFPGGVTEINFAKHTGLPSATGTISVAWNGLTKTLTIDSLGTVVEN